MPRAPKWGLLLAPGAGASSDAPALLAIEAALEDEVVVHRMDFPYRLAGRRAPDRQPVLVQAFVEEARAFSRRKRIARHRLFVGGRSMGGRMASIAVAEGLPAAGLVLASYPLHPPGKPEKLRVDHFPALALPCLFVSGDRDAFGTPKEFRRHQRAIPGEVTATFIKGGDHGMARHNEVVAEHVRAWVLRQCEDA